MKIDKAKIRKVLFITLNNLGDIILTTPVLQRIYREMPKAEIDVITGEAGEEIFSKHPAVKDIFIRKSTRGIKKRIKETADLYKRRYDFVIDLKKSLIPWIVGAKYHPRLNILNRLVSRKQHMHKRDEHLMSLCAFGMNETFFPDFFIPINHKDQDRADKIIGQGKNKRMITINPGSKSHLKRWPAEKFAELSDRLVNKLNCRVFVIGNEDDEETVALFKSHVKEDITDLCSRTSLGVLFEIIKRSDAIITGDSAPLHIASAVETNTVAIFGPSDEKKYGPLSNKHFVVKPKVRCRPCSRALCAVGPDEGCLPRIEVDEVFRAVKKILEK